VKRIAFLVLLFTTLFISSCQRTRYSSSDEYKSYPIAFSTDTNNILVKKKYISFYLDSMGTDLRLIIYFDFPKSFHFPIKKGFADTLTETTFLVELKADGNTIFSGYKQKEMMSNVLAPLTLKTDTVNLIHPSNEIIAIPFYAFHTLKQGVHNLEIKITQGVVRSNHDNKVTYYDQTFKHISDKYVRFHANFPLIDISLKCKVNVPAIHHTILYNKNIEVKKDSTFNPYSSDNTIWKSPLPDMYWQVYYPNEKPYFSSHYVSSTTQYTNEDTVNLYHYNMADTLGFGVFDHDNLSKDDCLGYKQFGLKSIIKNKWLVTTFDNIKVFSVQADYKGIINKK
jgi:hypothetical protein